MWDTADGAEIGSLITKNYQTQNEVIHAEIQADQFKRERDMWKARAKKYQSWNKRWKDHCDYAEKTLVDFNLTNQMKQEFLEREMGVDGKFSITENLSEEERVAIVNNRMKWMKYHSPYNYEMSLKHLGDIPYFNELYRPELDPDLDATVEEFREWGKRNA